MNIPKNISNYSNALHATQLSTNNLAVSSGRLQSVFTSLNSTQQASILIKIQNSQMDREQKQELTSQLLALTQLDDKEKENIQTKLREIEVKGQNALATRRETDELAKKLGNKTGMSTGMLVGTSVVSGIFAVINSFSTAKQAKNSGDAFGRGFGNAATSAIMGAGIGTMFAPGVGTVVGAAAGAILSAGSSIVGYQSANIERAIAKADELSEAHTQAQRAATDNLSRIRSLESEFNSLSSGVSKYGENISLSVEDFDKYRNIIDDILSINPRLIAGWDNEGRAIANKNGLIEQTIALLEEENRLRLEANLSDESLKTYLSGVTSRYQEQESILDELKAKGSLNGTFLASWENTITNMIFRAVQERGGYDSDFILDLEAKLNVSFGGNSPLFNDIREYENVKAVLEELGASTEDLDTFYADITANIVDYEGQLSRADAKLSDISKGLNPILQQVPLLVTGYSSLSDAQKDFITQYVNAFRVVGSTTDTEVQNMKKNILDFTTAITNSPEAQTAIDELFEIDLSKPSQYVLDEFDRLLSIISEKLEVNPIEITDKIGFDYKTEIDNIKFDLVEMFNEMGAFSGKNNWLIAERFTFDLPLEELREVHRILGEIKDESEFQTVADNLLEIYSNEDLMKKVRDLQTELDNDEITILEYDEKLYELSNTLRDTAPNAVDTFLAAFARTVPAVTNATSLTIAEMKKLMESVDKLQTAIDKVKNGEPLSRDDIIELIDKGKIDWSDIITNDDGFMSVPLETLEKGLDKFEKTWQAWVSRQIAGLIKARNELSNTYDIDSEEYKNEYGKLTDQIRTMRNVSKVNITDNTDYFSSLNNALEKYNSVTTEIEQAYWVDSYEKAFKSIEQGFISGNVNAEKFNEAIEKTNNLYVNMYDNALKQYSLSSNDEEKAYWASVANDALSKLHDQAKKGYFELDRYATLLKRLGQSTKSLSDQLSDMHSSYKTLRSAIEDFNSGHKISIDTFISLLQLSPEYLACLDLENGKLIINKQAVENLIEAMKTEAIAKLQAAAASDIQYLAEGRLEAMSKLAKDAVASLGDNAKIAGGKMKEGAEGALEFAAGVASILAAKGVDTSNITDGLDAILLAYQNAAKKISEISGVTDPSSIGKSGSSSGKDPAEDALAELKHLRAMEIISEEEYYSRLEQLRKKYYEGEKKYIQQNRQLLEEQYNFQKAHTNRIISAKQQELSILEKDNERITQNLRGVAYDENAHTTRSKGEEVDREFRMFNYEGNMKRQLELWGEIKDEAQAALDLRRKLLEDQGASKIEILNDSEMQEYQRQIYDSEDAVTRIQRKAIDDRLAMSERYIADRNYHNDWGADNEILALQRVMKYLEEYYQKGLLMDEEYYQLREEYMHRYYDSIDRQVDEYISRLEAAARAEIDIQRRIVEEKRKSLQAQVSLEEARLNIDKDHFKLINDIESAQKNITAVLEANKTSFKWLNEDLRKEIFNEDDYAILSDALTDINKQADKLYNDYQPRRKTPAFRHGDIRRNR